MAKNPKFDALLDKIRELHNTKNDDYSGQKDPFANFRLCERMGIPAWVGVIVRMSDKFARITNFVKNREFKVKEESIVDTLMDLAVYSLIAILLFQEEQSNLGNVTKDEKILS